MDKTSYYNTKINHNNRVLLYNTLTDSLMSLTAEEFSTISELFEDLQTFKGEYPMLYEELKESGFIVNQDYNELDYIKLQNKRRIYGENSYHITINPTLDCNVACWYCSTEYANATHNGGMSPDVINNVIAHIRNVIQKQKAAAFHLDWFGGEPLMYFDKVIKPISTSANKLTKESGVKFTQHITTNATLINVDRIKYMRDLNFTSFQIPIDGNEKRHNKIKYFENKEGTYRKVIENINLITDIIPDVFIILRINYDKQTLKNIQDIIKDISETSKKHIRIDFQKVWQVPFTEEERKLLEKAKKEFFLNGLESGFWAYRPKAFYRCYADKFRYYAINYDGKIFKCTARDYGEDKVIGRLLSDGDVDWNDKLLSIYYSKSTFENAQCLECRMLPMCMGPCIQKNYDSRINSSSLPCVFENAEYSLSSFIVEKAKSRNLIN